MFRTLWSRLLKTKKNMGKHLLTKEERIMEARARRKYMNRRHHIEAKKNRAREVEILKQIKIKEMPLFWRRVEMNSWYERKLTEKNRK
jgi:hypothetical protein